MTNVDQRDAHVISKKRPWWKRLCVSVDDDDKIQDDMSDVVRKTISEPENDCPNVDRFVGCASTLEKLRSVQRSKQRTKNFDDCYCMEKLLGQGAFARTYRATEKNALGRTVVVKKTYGNVHKQDCAEFLHLRQMTNPHIVRFFDCFEDKSHQYIVMEYCAGGDLHYSMQTVSNMPGGKTNEWCAAVFRQVLTGVMYLHTQFQRQHNDLKPENILLDRKPRHNLDVPRTMIADFGCVVKGADGEKSIGDPRYSAPEVHHSKAISEASDAWSLGVTLYELLTGELPLVDHASMGSWQAFKTFGNGTLVRKLKVSLEAMMKGQLVEANCDKISDPMGCELTRALLQVDPQKRITLSEAWRREFFSSADGLLSKHKERLSSAPVAAHLNVIQNFKLRLVLLQLVTSKLQGEHLNYYASMFDEADEDHDGVLNMSSFAKLWASVDLPDCVQKPSAEEMFQIIDVDADGHIDFDEFVAFFFDMDKLDKESRRQCLRSAFASICDPDDRVEFHDFQGLFAHEALPVVKRLFWEMDTKRDGHIDFPQFKQYIKDFQPSYRHRLRKRIRACIA